MSRTPVPEGDVEEAADYSGHDQDHDLPPSPPASPPESPLPPPRTTDDAPLIFHQPYNVATNEHEQLIALMLHHKLTRARFVLKVFGVLSMQMAVMCTCVCCFSFVPKLRSWTVAQSAYHKYIYWTSYVLFGVCYLSMACCVSVRRRFPGNLICTIICTVTLTLMCVMVTVYHDTITVAIALGICTLCCVAVVAFSIQTRIDFTAWQGVAFVMLLVLLVFGLTCGLVCWADGDTHRFLAIDTQMVMGGKRFELCPDDWLFASLQLFLDIVLIFQFLLLGLRAGKGN